MKLDRKKTIKLSISFFTILAVCIIMIITLTKLLKKPAEYTESISESMSEAMPTMDRLVDFNEWQEKNEDVYAWINIPDSNINFPILQSPDTNRFYLNHDINRESAVHGAIFTEKRNTKTFNDYNTLIYGHNMFNGTMFTPLRKYEKQEFFDSHRDVYILTPEKAYKYRVFAAYITDDRHVLSANDFSTVEGYQAYIDKLSVLDDGVFDKSIKLTTDDRIITLSTCVTPAGGNVRYLVQAVLDTVYAYNTDN